MLWKGVQPFMTTSLPALGPERGFRPINNQKKIFGKKGEGGLCKLKLYNPPPDPPLVLVICICYECKSTCAGCKNNASSPEMKKKYRYINVPYGAPLPTLSNLYDVPVVFLTPPPILRLGIALFAVAKGWLLLDIGWFVLFLGFLQYNLS